MVIEIPFRSQGCAKWRNAGAMTAPTRSSIRARFAVLSFWLRRSRRGLIHVLLVTSKVGTRKRQHAVVLSPTHVRQIPRCHENSARDGPPRGVPSRSRPPACRRQRIDSAAWPGLTWPPAPACRRTDPSSLGKCTRQVHSARSPGPPGYIFRRVWDFAARMSSATSVSSAGSPALPAGPAARLDRDNQRRDDPARPVRGAKRPPATAGRTSGKPEKAGRVASGSRHLAHAPVKTDTLCHDGGTGHHKRVAVPFVSVAARN